MTLASTTSRPVLALLAVALAAAACSDTATGPPNGAENPLTPGNQLLPPDANITLEAEADGFAPGDSVTLVLRNDSNAEVGFNLCFHVLEEHDGLSWSEADVHEERICTLVLHILQPGGTASYETALPDAIQPGIYRFRVALHLMEDGTFRDQATAEFSVE